MRLTVFCFLGAVLSLMSFADSLPVSEMEFIRAITAHKNPAEYGNAAYWSNHWSVASVFYDLNQDGRLDALVATNFERTDQSYDWIPLQRKLTGEIVVTQNLDDSQITSCPPSGICEVVYDGGIRFLAGFEATVETYKAQKRVLIQKGDVIFRTRADGAWAPQFPAGGFDGIVGNPAFRRIERVRVSWYSGFDLKSVPPDPRDRIEPEDARPNGGIVRPNGFAAFARHYCADLRRRLGLDRKVTLFAVFLDADNDRDADFYISSDAERTTDGRYRWTLFLNDGGTFRRAKERQWFKDGPSGPRWTLEAEEVAGRDDFYRLVRTYGAPRVVLLGSVKGRLQSYAYRTLVPAEMRLRRPPDDPALRHAGEYCYEQWHDEVWESLGFEPALDFHDFFRTSTFHSLERIPCETFPED